MFDLELADRHYVDDDVKAEIDRVEAILDGSQTQEAITVSKLKKWFITETEEDQEESDEFGD